MSTNQSGSKGFQNLLPDDWQKRALRHLGILAGIAVLLLLYFRPVLDGKVMDMQDIKQNKGMAKEVRDYRAETGDEALWAGNMFSGMPAYQISTKYPKTLSGPISRVLTLGMPHPVSILFLLAAGMYLLLLTLGVNPWLAGLGALGYAFSSYFFIALEAGHNSKIQAMCYVAPVIAGIIMAYQGKRLLGTALTAIFMALMINANHMQITYYMFFIIMCLAISELVVHWKEKKIKEFSITSGFLVAAVVVALGANVSRMWTTYEYSQETIRGKSTLKTSDDPAVGLKRDYTFQWSYGVGETFTLLFPNFHGGASGGQITAGSATYDLMKSKFGEESAKRATESWPTYWGAQPFTSGPVYIGAIFIFLFILGLVILDGRMKWWLLAATILSITLAWGKNMGWWSDLWFYNFPMYNRFRAVSMMLVIAEFTIPLMGILALNKLIQQRNKISPELMKRALMISAGSIVAIGVVFLLGGSAFFDFSSPKDSGSLARIVGGQKGSLVADLSSALISDRQSMFTMDILRSLGLVLAAGAAVWLFMTNKIKQNVFYPALAILLVADLWPVNQRYLNENNFVEKTEFDNAHRPSAADAAILRDKDPNYRVFNITRDAFQDAYTSYHHKSIGGYHAAKLRRYNDLITRHLSGYQQGIGQAFGKGGPETEQRVNAAMARMPVMNMLNVKYIIYNPQGGPLVNQNRLGNAWYVDEVQFTDGPDDEIEKMRTFNPAKTALVEKSWQGKQLSGFTPRKDPNGSITFEKYTPKYLKYNFNAASEQLVVFSEIYYNDKKGWNAYIDGKLTPHFRANYILRAMRVPAGQHTVEFKFEPKSYHTGEMISLIMSLVLFGGFFFVLYKSMQEDAAVREREKPKQVAPPKAKSRPSSRERDGDRPKRDRRKPKGRPRKN